MGINVLMIYLMLFAFIEAAWPVEGFRGYLFFVCGNRVGHDYKLKWMGSVKSPSSCSLTVNAGFPNTSLCTTNICSLAYQIPHQTPLLQNHYAILGKLAPRLLLPQAMLQAILSRLYCISSLQADGCMMNLVIVPLL